MAATASKGFYYVRSRAKGRWTVYHEFWTGGVKQQLLVQPAHYRSLGLDASMNLEQARATVKAYNKFNKRKPDELNRQIRAEKRVQGLVEDENALFKATEVESFLTRLLAASDGQQRFKNRLIACFTIVRQMCLELRLKPHQYAEEVDLIVGYFKKKQYSVPYCQDILYVLNKWGKFKSKSDGSYYEPITKLRLKTQAALAAINSTKKGVRRASKPLTWELLRLLAIGVNKNCLTDAQKLNWLKVSLAFGLRPSEVDGCIKQLQLERHGGVDVLVVVQTKLTVVHEHERLKRIPVLCKEQLEALQALKLKQVKRPLAAWLKQLYAKAGIEGHYDLYAGRKGFTDFMLGLGQPLEQISVWAGHKSMDTTWTFYKDRSSVQFKPTNFTKRSKAG